ncbi:MAG: diacylglycerol kinase family lipid kinase [Lachnospiraceae bacterium]|nr:diacylglycerol kinase family lipid kinase [Lachnospiraceae bacterium]
MLHFIVNPASRSGKGKKIWKELLPTIKHSSIQYDVHMTEGEGHATRLAAELSEKADGAVDAYVVTGGDGTLNEVVNGLLDASQKQPLVGFIPTGSGNDFARNLKISDDPAKALRDVLHARQIKEVDSGTITCGEITRHFLVSAGIGYDADVCDVIAKSTSKNFFNKLHIGSVAYTWLGLKQAALYKKASGTITFDSGVSMDLKDIAFISFHNVCTEGGGWPFAPDSLPDDGVLDICIVATKSRFKFAAALISSKMNGRHKKSSAVHIIKSKSAHLVLDKKLTVHTDGEILGEYDELTVRCDPASLRLMVK